MKNLRYIGRDDSRELSPTDLDKLGVENAEATIVFKPGQSTTLEDSVADILLERVRDLREATPEELKYEERQLEAELGFEPYNPGDHTVAEVSSTLANSNDERRNYILDQEYAGQNRKGVFQAVGAQWKEKEQPSSAEETSTDEAVDQPHDDVDDNDVQGNEVAEAGGSLQSSGDAESASDHA